MEDIINVIVYGTPYGVPGATGAQGPVGPGNTLMGPTGPTGPTGPEGIQGNPGAKGNPGEQGDPGPQGLQGNTGATGIQGNTGATGNNGATGTTGIRGTTGAGYLSESGTGVFIGDWSVGNIISFTVVALPLPAYSIGQTLIISDNNDPTNNYLIGTITNWVVSPFIANQGEVTLTLTKVVGSGTVTDWTLNLFGEQGLQGNTGNPGATGLQGSTGPTGTTGTPGDLYSTTSGTAINLSTTPAGSVVFLSVPTGLAYSTAQSVLAAVSITQYFNGFVSSYAPPGMTISVTGVSGSGVGSNWKVNLAGAVGQQGEIGPQGSPGPQGPTGSQGNTGGTGSQGNTGATGAGSTAPGPQGNTGPTGPQGNTGATGNNGNTGNRGTTGTTGAGYLSVSGQEEAIGDYVVGDPITFSVFATPLPAYSVGQSLIIAIDANNYFIGTVTNWNSATSVVSLNITKIVGSGTSFSWTINLIGEPGIQGNTGATGADGISGPYVITFNGLTGDVTGVTTGTANNFVALQTFSSGISASGGTFSNDIIVKGNVRIGRGVGGASSNLAFGSTNLGGTGTNNIAIGNSALANNITGSSNIAIGSSALVSVIGSIKNIGIGRNVLQNLQGGTGNIAIGDTSLQQLQSGSNNIAIGIDAGLQDSFGLLNNFSTESIFIGNNTKLKFPTAANQPNQIVIGHNAIGLGANTTTIGITTQSLATIYGLLNVPSGISGINQFVLNGFTGSVTLAAGNNVGITFQNNVITFSSTGACGSCGPIILDDTVYITGVCATSLISIDTITDDMLIYGNKKITIGGTTPSIFDPGLVINNTTDSLNFYATNIGFTGNVTNITGNLVNQFNGLTGNVTGVTSISQGAGILLTGSTTSPTITNSGVRQIIGTSSQISVSPVGGTGTVTVSLPTVINNVNEISSVLESSLTLIGNSDVSDSSSIVLSPSGLITANGILNVSGAVGVSGALTVSGNYNGTVVRSFNGNTGAVQGVSTLTNTGPLGSFISLSGSTGNINIVNRGVLQINGITGNIALISGSNITIGLCASTKEITISATGGSATSDGSAIISKLYPRLPENGLCAGDLISYNGTDSWFPTPREYLVTPSLWQTKPTADGDYPASVNMDPLQSRYIDGSCGGKCPVGELIQISLSSQDGPPSFDFRGVTLSPGTWWINITKYDSFSQLYAGNYSGLRIFNVDTTINTATYGSNIDIAGFAMLIRGTTYNAYDGRGGPFGNTSCNVDPNTMPLGVGSDCDGIGVDTFVICTPRYGNGFTYGGEFYECLNV
jgi:hypothetical protein